MLPIFFQGIHFILLSRYKIGTSRKYLSNRTYLCGNMFDTVKYHVIFITENDIAVFSHQSMISFLCLRSPRSSKCSISNTRIRSISGCVIEVIRPLATCFRSSIQKFGAVIGLGLFVPVIYTSGKDALADKSRRF